MIERKSEYQRRVSPIVRIGGRPNEIHMLMMKTKKMAVPIAERITAVPGRLPLKAKNIPHSQKITDSNDIIGNCSQLISYPPFSAYRQ